MSLICLPWTAWLFISNVICWPKELANKWLSSPVSNAKISFLGGLVLLKSLVCFYIHWKCGGLDWEGANSLYCNLAVYMVLREILEKNKTKTCCLHCRKVAYDLPSLLQIPSTMPAEWHAGNCWSTRAGWPQADPAWFTFLCVYMTVNNYVVNVKKKKLLHAIALFFAQSLQRTVIAFWRCVWSSRFIHSLGPYILKLYMLPTAAN